MKDYTENISEKNAGHDDFKEFEKFRKHKMEQYSCLNAVELISKKQRLQVQQYYRENIDVFSLSRDGLAIATAFAAIAALVAALGVDADGKISIEVFVLVLLVEVVIFGLEMTFPGRKREKKRLQACTQCKIAIQCIGEILEKRESDEKANKIMDISGNTEDIKQFVVTLKEKK